MTLAVTQGGRVWGTAAVSSTTQVLASGITCAQYDMIVVVIGADNNGASGVTSTASVTDAKGHTYTNRLMQNNDPGAAAAGCTLAFYTTEVGAAGLSSTDNITANFSPATVCKAMIIFKVSPASGKRVSFNTSAGANNVAANTATITTGSMVTDELVFGAGTAEGNTCDWQLADSDTTNGSWSGYDAAGSVGDSFDANAAVTTWQSLICQYKLVTGSGTQTYNPTGDVAGDRAIGYITLLETTPVTFIASPFKRGPEAVRRASRR